VEDTTEVVAEVEVELTLRRLSPRQIPQGGGSTSCGYGSGARCGGVGGGISSGGGGGISGCSGGSLPEACACAA